MIEINLLEQKKPFKLPVILGVDLAQVNIKPIILVLLIGMIPDYLLYPQWDEESQNMNSEIRVLEKKLRSLQKDLRGNQQVKKQLDAFNLQVEKLKQRSNQVDSIIKKRTNPTKLLERIARNIPDDMWLNEVDINNDKKIRIKGNSKSYKSIGNFIILVNESSFFGKSLTLSDSKTVEDKDKGKSSRLEDFTIQGDVVSFDPWQQ